MVLAAVLSGVASIDAEGGKSVCGAQSMLAHLSVHLFNWPLTPLKSDFHSSNMDFFNAAVLTSNKGLLIVTL